jgi:CRP-like cAMP-binding protein
MQVVTGDRQDSVFVGLPDAFRRLDSIQRAELGKQARVRTLQRNEILIGYGDPNPCAFAIRTGMLSIGYPAGPHEIVITDFFTTHDVYTPNLAPHEPAGYQVRSVGRSVVVTWPLPVFNNALASNARFCYWYLEHSKRRLELHRMQKARMRGLDLEARYAYFLWGVAETTDGGRREVTVKIPQQAIASYLGVSREEVSRKKQLLEKAGFIAESPRGLVLSPRLPNLFATGDESLLPWETA